MDVIRSCQRRYDAPETRGTFAGGLRKTRGVVVVSYAVALILGALFAAPARAQESGGAIPEGTLIVDVLPKFVTSFRNNSWVPVDVLVSNNKQDISGTIDVTLYANDEPQAPVYRLPIESPKNSIKRFRMYCYFSNTTQLTAMLYNGRRAALQEPVRLTLRPIDPNDVLMLILDDEALDYGFLFNAIQRVGEGMGFHRETLRTEDLSQLPEYPQCYDPFTIIVAGKIDPEAVPSRQRDLIRRYVEHGGVFAVMVGENAARYKGTWVEGLAGVSIGEIEPADELEYARRLFSEANYAGAREGKSVVVSRITPSPGTYLRAPEGAVTDAPPLATLRRIGSGHVAAIAVDAAGKALHGVEGFEDLWCDLIMLREEASELNYDFASTQAQYTLPAATGIRVYPRSSVMAYLGLYFGVGIVGNWLFWSLLKRREMAWLCLVVISFGFTAYALVYGTAGRAKATEVAQLEVLRLPVESQTAKLRSTVGIVAARSSRYSISLQNDYSLVSDVSAQSVPGMPMQDGLLSRVNQYQFVEGPESRLSNFTVGASEMRVIQVESEVPTPGALAGKLTWDETGIHGELINASGLRIASPFVLIGGRRIPIRVENEKWRVEVGNESLTGQPMAMRPQNQFWGMYYGGALMDQTALRESFLEHLVTSEGNMATYDSRVGPFICGWIEGKPYRSIDLGEPATERIFSTLLVADVPVERLATAGPRNVELEVRLAYGDANAYMRQGYYGSEIRQTHISAETDVSIIVPRFALARPDAEMLVDVLWQGELQEILFRPEDAPTTWAGENRVASQSQRNDYGFITTTTYRVADWAKRIGDRGVLIGKLWPSEDVAARGGNSADVRARLLIPQTDTYGGEWILWQS